MDKAEARSSFDLMKVIMDNDHTIYETILPEEIRTIADIKILGRFITINSTYVTTITKNFLKINHLPRPIGKVVR